MTADLLRPLSQTTGAVCALIGYGAAWLARADENESSVASHASD